MKNINLVLKSLISAIVCTISVLVIIAIHAFNTVSIEEPGIFTTYFYAIRYEVLLDYEDFGFILDFSLGDTTMPIWITLLLFFILFLIYEYWRQKKKLQLIKEEDGTY